MYVGVCFVQKRHKGVLVSLRSKVFAVVLSVIGFNLAVAVGIISYVVYPGFVDLERAEANKDTQRVVEAVQREIHHLETLCRDWAAWDSPYSFMIGEDNTFVEENMVVSSFVDNGLSVIQLVTYEGEVIVGQNRDRHTGEMIAIDFFPQDWLPADHPLLPTDTAGIADFDEGVSGLLMTSIGPMLVSALPILTSDTEGPSRGRMIMGRPFDEGMMITLSEQTQVSIQTWNIGGPDTEGFPAHVMDNLPDDTSTYLAVQGDDLLHFYTFFSDIAGKPAVLLRAEILRSITLGGSRVTGFAVSSIVIVSLLVLVTLSFALQRMVVGPIGRLTEHAVAVGKSTDLTERIALESRDEIGELGLQINDMIGRLAEARDALLEQSYHSGLSEMASGILHNVRNALTPMSAQVGKVRQDLNAVALDRIEQALSELKDEQTVQHRRVLLEDYVRQGSVQMAGIIKDTGEEFDDLNRHLSQIEEILSEQDKYSHFQRVPVSLNIGQILEQAIAFMPRQLRDLVRIDIDQSIHVLPSILVEKIILVQVLTNLFNNAAESIRAADMASGLINITGHTESSEGVHRVCLVVSDNGKGMDEETIKKAFVRGFSTKRGKLSGIGLHWSANNMNAMGGDLRVESDGLGRGARFLLSIPVSDGQERGGSHRQHEEHELST